MNSTRSKRKPKSTPKQSFGVLPIVEIPVAKPDPVPSTVSHPVASAAPSTLRDTDCILFLPIPTDILCPSQKSWESDQLFRYNPSISEPEAFDPHVDTFYDLSESGRHPTGVDHEKTKSSSSSSSSSHHKTPTYGKAVRDTLYGRVRPRDTPTGTHGKGGRDPIVRFTTNQQFTISLNEWPSGTDQWCGHCCDTFDTTPIFLPLSVTMDGKWVIDPTYSFCTFSCARAYNEDTTKNVRRLTEINTLLHLLKQQMTGKYDPIIRSPPRYLRDVFRHKEDEHMTIDDFHRDFHTTITFFPPLKPMSVISETVVAQTHTTTIPTVR